MESFGEFLRRERELRHIELNEISKITKIKKSYLLAIENDTYDELPDIAFIKGFIRAYCNYIGLDADQTLTYFQQCYDDRFVQAGSPQRRLFPISAARKNLYASIGIGAVLIAVAAGAVYHFSKGGSQALKPESAVSPSGPTSTTVAVPFTQQATRITRTAAARVTTPAAAPLTVTTREHTLLLKATETTWVELAPTVPGGKARNMFLEPGQQVLWRFTGTAMLTVGNAQGASIIFDKKPLRHNVTRADVIRLRLSD